jgi:hypothetical protein
MTPHKKSPRNAGIRAGILAAAVVRVSSASSKHAEQHQQQNDTDGYTQ